MFNTRQTILASRPAAMVLALTLVAALSTPFVILTGAHAGGTPLACAENNNNGCTELSATPPQDTQAVPPNVVLMLDDSGSMAWDFMPDWAYLSVQNNWGARDSAVNDVYYNPATLYSPPPKADSTTAAPDLYPNSPGLTDAYKDGFLDTSTTDVTHYKADNTIDFGNAYPYYESLKTTNTTGGVDHGPASWNPPYTTGGGCPAGYTESGGTCIPPPDVSEVTKYKCSATPPHQHGPTTHNHQQMCYITTNTEHGPVTTWYNAVSYQACPSGTSADPSHPGKCKYPPKNPSPVVHHDGYWSCPSGGSTNSGAPPPPATAPRCTSGGNPIYEKVFTYVVGPADSGHAHYVAAGTGCDILASYTQKSNCTNEGDTSGVAAPATDASGNPLSAGQNVANWFSYYRTRILMTKSGLMTAFVKVNPNYRFGFGSINANGKANIPSTPTPYTFDNAGCGGYCGDTNNQLAVVQPFGDGSPGTQKALFWNWIANETANNLTPLRKALQAVGEYYKTSQPWTTMSTDPGWTTGSTTKYACRASYTILSTDGFWNGDAPTSPAMTGVTDSDGPNNAPVPAGDITNYSAASPFSGGTTSGEGPSLADVATYYWETDLMTGADWPNEVPTSPQDPAAWQHMTTFTIGLGFTPTGISGTFPHPANPIQDIEAWAAGGAVIPGFAWPTPSGAANSGNGSVYNIADLAHAAINGHGEFFNVTKPTDVADALTKAFKDIAAQTDVSPSAAVNASVLSLGALSFSTGYETKNWGGMFKAVALNPDATVGATEWNARANLDAAYHSANYTSRTVWTDAYNSASTPAFSTFQFTAANSSKLDPTELAGLGGDTDCTTAPASDTICNRIKFLLGDPTNEGGLYRTRARLLGAIIRSQPVYVAAATSGYYDNWPAGSPELGGSAQSYDAFVSLQSTRAGTVYVGANDGMLHAFDAPVPTGCVYSGSPPVPTCNYNPDGTAGNERWAFIPRAVYANLGNLTDINFSFLPTVDETPVTRDVFFGQTAEAPTDNKWHTILAGGVGLGGRGVYALDITDPTAFSASSVLWEFDSDSSVSGCKSIVGTGLSGSCSASDLGYTVSQPNIGRINYNNKWVVLVPNGYFPDCSTPDIPTATVAGCQAIAAQAPKDASGNPYSALFVLDAETGSVIAEMKTPQISGVTSFGLSTPVMGDYLGNQVDTVAFAGDVEGNLWRFDMSDANPSNWTVTLVYKASVQGAQPITTMPRLFPDPSTNRFMVVFGTGKFLGIGDNSDDTVQAIYGVRDVAGTTYTQSDLTQQYLHEETPTTGPYANITLRCITGSASDSSCTSSPTPLNDVPGSSGGWFINLKTTTSDGTVNDAGERVVVTPSAIFSSNTVIVGTLITGAENTDACNPSTQGSILALNVLSGGTAGVSSLGGGMVAGARITNAPTSGTFPIVSAVGGAKGFPAGSNLLGGSGIGPVIDEPMYRRRSWHEIKQDQ